MTCPVDSRQNPCHFEQSGCKGICAACGYDPTVHVPDSGSRESYLAHCRERLGLTVPAARRADKVVLSEKLPFSIGLQSDPMDPSLFPPEKYVCYSKALAAGLPVAALSAPKWLNTVRLWAVSHARLILGVQGYPDSDMICAIPFECRQLSELIPGFTAAGFFEVGFSASGEEGFIQVFIHFRKVDRDSQGNACYGQENKLEISQLIKTYSGEVRQDSLGAKKTVWL